jgi:hypothetical protein
LKADEGAQALPPTKSRRLDASYYSAPPPEFPSSARQYSELPTHAEYQQDRSESSERPTPPAPKPKSRPALIDLSAQPSTSRSRAPVKERPALASAPAGVKAVPIAEYIPTPIRHSRSEFGSPSRIRSDRRSLSPRSQRQLEQYEAGRIRDEKIRRSDSGSRPLPVNLTTLKSIRNASLISEFL